MNHKAMNENKGQKAFRIIMLVFAACTLLVTLLVSLTTYFYGFDTWVAGHNAAKPYLAIWRLLLFILIIGFWKRWIKWLAQWANLTSEQYEMYLHYRWRFALWLIIIEAVIVQNILAVVFDGL